MVLLIENFVIGVFGFQIGNVFILVGVFKIVCGMFEDIVYCLEGGVVICFCLVKGEGLCEGDIVVQFGEFQSEYFDVFIGSYFYFFELQDGKLWWGIQLVVCVIDEIWLDVVIDCIIVLVKGLGYELELV